LLQELNRADGHAGGIVAATSLMVSFFLKSSAGKP
jgi:hypothetical protein